MFKEIFPCPFCGLKVEIKLNSPGEFDVSPFQQCMMLVYVSMHYFLVALLVALAMYCALLCVCDKLKWHSGNVASCSDMSMFLQENKDFSC